MRESASKQLAATQTVGDNNVAFASTQAEEQNGVSAFINDDICAVILDVSLQRMLKKNVVPGPAPSAEAFKLWSDEFDGKSDFSQYQSRLVRIHLLFLLFLPNYSLYVDVVQYVCYPLAYYCCILFLCF